MKWISCALLIGCGTATSAPVEEPVAVETSPCADRCTTPEIGSCMIACLREHCERGESVCPPATCREADDGSWSCDAACSADGTTRYETRDPDGSVGGSDVEIVRGGGGAETDDEANVVRYTLRCGG